MYMYMYLCKLPFTAHLATYLKFPQRNKKVYLVGVIFLYAHTKSSSWKEKEYENMHGSEVS